MMQSLRSKRATPSGRLERRQTGRRQASIGWLPGVVEWAQWHCGPKRPEHLNVQSIAIFATTVAILLFSFNLVYVVYFPVAPTCDMVAGSWEPRVSNVLLHGGDELTALNFTTSLNVLPPMLAPQVKEELLDLLGEFLDMLDKHDIEVIMFQGTLLGSFFFHDMIPWDDDIDLFINIKDINKLRAMFRDPVLRETYDTKSFHDPYDMYSADALWFDIPLDDTYNCGPDRPGICYHQGKIYRHTSRPAGRRPWKFPFIDFMFYGVNETHFFNHEKWSRNGKIVVPVEDIYPLHLRPLNRFWMKAPRNPLAPMREKFGDFNCRQGFWNHQKEHMNLGYFYNYDDQCNQTHICYPTVRRRPAGKAVWQKPAATVSATDKDAHWLSPASTGGNGVIEELVFRGTVLQSVVIEDEIYRDPYVLTFQARERDLWITKGASRS